VVKANPKYVQCVQMAIFKHVHCSWVNFNRTWEPEIGNESDSFTTFVCQVRMKCWQFS